jgi:hypothetical protein
MDFLKQTKIDGGLVFVLWSKWFYI